MLEEWRDLLVLHRQAQIISYPEAESFKDTSKESWWIESPGVVGVAEAHEYICHFGRKEAVPEDLLGKGSIYSKLSKVWKGEWEYRRHKMDYDSHWNWVMSSQRFIILFSPVSYAEYNKFKFFYNKEIFKTLKIKFKTDNKIPEIPWVTMFYIKYSKNHIWKYKPSYKKEHRLWTKSW